MKETKSRAGRAIIVVGFALFSMFFGAGNVIFPPYLGLGCGREWVLGFLCYYLADIGLAQLAMHASYETAGCADVEYMIRALRQFYKTNIITSADGEYQLV